MLRELAVHAEPEVPDDPDQRQIAALQKALNNTTPEYAGTPWDDEGDEDERREEPGIWVGAGD